MLLTKYNRARYYDPMNGRFISFDPILHPVNGKPQVSSCSGSISYPAFDGLLSNPQKLNPFTYVENNSINRTDPSGLASVSACSYYNGVCNGMSVERRKIYVEHPTVFLLCGVSRKTR